MLVQTAGHCLVVGNNGLGQGGDDAGRCGRAQPVAGATLGSQPGGHHLESATARQPQTERFVEADAANAGVVDAGLSTGEQPPTRVQTAALVTGQAEPQNEST